MSAIARPLVTILVTSASSSWPLLANARLARQCPVETAVHCARYARQLPPVLCRRSALLSGTSEEFS